jgi:pimeloyl-ACP methyl ester carboxylesterase
VREWDFDLDEIQIPILLFHGGLDKNMPLARVQQTANQLHDAQLVTYPEDGHISTFTNHSDEIVKALLPD